MNITQAVIVDLEEKFGQDIANKLKNNPEIQIYTNHHIFEYQWRDSRFPEYSDVWENDSFKTRTELTNGIYKYLTK